MAHFIKDNNPNSEEIKTLLRKIPTTPGVCIFIDIVNSTALKHTSSLEHWGRLHNNTFNMISFLNDFPDYIVKGIGDEIMLYIPNDALKLKEGINDYYSLLYEIYATIDNIKNYPLENTFLNCKVSIHYCTDVYNITFFKGYNDYYGKDIDLSARLMTKAKVNRIVISEAFNEKVEEDFRNNSQYKNERLLDQISPKYIEDFKGIPYATEYRIIEV